LYDRVSHTFAPWSPTVLVEWFLLTSLLLATLRLGARGVQRLLRAGGINARGFAVLGVNELGFQLAANIANTPDLGLKLVGFFDDRPPHRVPPVPPEIGKRVGDIQQLIELARSGEIDRIYITLPMRAEERIRRLLTELSDSTASVYIVPDFFVFELLHSCWTDIGGLPVVAVFDHPFYGVDGILKRGTDFALASLLLVFMAVPMLLVAAAVKLTSPGPVFFRQRRYGMDGQEIRVWKFRTMDANEDGPIVRQATRDDARITSIGGFLRRTSLDELPQLFNVLGGSMSLVGPRPHATAHNEEYRRHIRGYMLRHKVRPGITGLAQVNGWRGETDTLYKMEKRIEFDHQYIREWSLWKDFKILFRTIFTVFKRENAY
jgi:putative colanic acid biosynthesis UDP-glucose lipid carrier transferase